MTTSYTIPGCRRKLRTSAARRYLVVSAYDGYATVETTSVDLSQAQTTLVRYRREFPAATSLYLIDQLTGTVS